MIVLDSSFINAKLQVEGRGNGIKTVIPNMLLLANSLHRDPAEVTKFFGTELGSQTTWTAETESAVVNGAHTTQDLQSNLFKYVEKFVLCPGCRLPETIYKIKSETIYSVCAACGAKEPVDMAHKLTGTILAHDKKRKKDKKDAEKKEDKTAKKKGDKKSKVRADAEHFYYVLLFSFFSVSLSLSFLCSSFPLSLPRT